ncbi:MULTISPECIES: DUF3270 family protein [unclassified Streptococcus]|uniref:DUF3270 family protein n=1 Tax=unclassified Streptococcus TaxID=2608887 RepID=UPI0011B79DD8|nr:MULTISPECIES: DUF3270 family protein [unclassified Streptococcus]TWS94192.1 DUF3270 family protein [Streptococcus sp. sy018]TWT14711.1 DUF3270 family protein [Streptococcus sp. sy010]
MPANLKRQRIEEFEEDLQISYSPKYREFQELNSNSAKFRELVFFARVTIFSILSVLSCFVLLSLEIGVGWAFLLAILISTALTSTLSYFIFSMKH